MHNPTLQNLDADIIGKLQNAVIPRLAPILEYSKVGDEWSIVYRRMRIFNFDELDAKDLLAQVLETLIMLSEAGFVYDSIDKSDLYVSPDGVLLLGGQEKIRRRQNDNDVSQCLSGLAAAIRDGYQTASPDPLLVDLLTDMQKEDVNERPTLTEALSYPLFWDINRIKLMFERLTEFLSDERNKQGREEFDRESLHITRVNWTDHIDVVLLGEEPSWDGSRASDLVRLIRNRWCHPRPGFRCHGSEYFRYFSCRFPTLFLYMYHFYLKYVDESGAEVVPMPSVPLCVRTEPFGASLAYGQHGTS